MPLAAFLKPAPPITLPDLAAFDSPSANPTTPADWPAFTPTLGGSVTGPTLARTQSTASPGELVSLYGTPLDNTVPTIYGNTGYKTGSVIVKRNGDMARVQLDPNLPASSMYMLWVGQSRPLRINCTEAWWLYKDYYTSKVCLYGCNLYGAARTGGTLGVDNCWLWLQLRGDSTGQWIVPTAVNKFKVECNLPNGLLTMGTSTTTIAYATATNVNVSTQAGLGYKAGMDLYLIGSQYLGNSNGGYLRCRVNSYSGTVANVDIVEVYQPYGTPCSNWYVCPAYELWANNGLGQNRSWARCKQLLIIGDPIAWDMDVGTTVLDETAGTEAGLAVAKAALISAGTAGTIRLKANTTYTLTAFFNGLASFGKPIKLLGQGGTVIKAGANFNDVHLLHAMLENLTVDFTGGYYTTSGMDGIWLKNVDVIHPNFVLSGGAWNPDTLTYTPLGLVFTSGNWVQSTHTFTPTDGRTTSNYVSVGDVFNICSDNPAAFSYRAQVTAVAGGVNGAITFNATPVEGSAPASSSGNMSAALMFSYTATTRPAWISRKAFNVGDLVTVAGYGDFGVNYVAPIASIAAGINGTITLGSAVVGTPTDAFSGASMFGNWVQATRTFTPTDGTNPHSVLVVGDALFIDGAYSALVTSVTNAVNGAVVLSATPRTSSAPSDGARFARSTASMASNPGAPSTILVNGNNKKLWSGFYWSGGSLIGSLFNRNITQGMWIDSVNFSLVPQSEAPLVLWYCSQWAVSNCTFVDYDQKHGFVGDGGRMINYTFSNKNFYIGNLTATNLQSGVGKGEVILGDGNEIRTPVAQNVSSYRTTSAGLPAITLPVTHSSYPGEFAVVIDGTGKTQCELIVSADATSPGEIILAEPFTLALDTSSVVNVQSASTCGAVCNLTITGCQFQRGAAGITACAVQNYQTFDKVYYDNITASALNSGINEWGLKTTGAWQPVLYCRISNSSLSNVAFVHWVINQPDDSSSFPTFPMHLTSWYGIAASNATHAIQVNSDQADFVNISASSYTSMANGFYTNTGGVFTGAVILQDTIVQGSSSGEGYQANLAGQLIITTRGTGEVKSFANRNVATNSN